MAKNTILLIDYEPRSIERTKSPLVALGYRVAVATDGLAGVEAFERLKPDLVLIEAMIPKKHGFEVCQDLKKTPVGKRTPIIITTSVYKGRKYRTQALHMYGCDEYIEKPIPEDQFIEIVRRFLPVAVTAGGEIDSAESLDSMEFADEPPSSEDVIDLGSLDGESDSPEIDPAPRPMPRKADPPSAVGASPLADVVEDEIMARLDAIMPGASGSTATAAAMAFEIEVVETSIPDEVPTAPAAAESGSAQVVSFDAKRGKKGRKKQGSGKNRSMSQPDPVPESAPVTAPPPSAALHPAEAERPVKPHVPVRAPAATSAATPAPLLDAAASKGMPGWVWLLVIAGLALATFALLR